MEPCIGSRVCVRVMGVIHEKTCVWKHPFKVLEACGGARGGGPFDLCVFVFFSPGFFLGGDFWTTIPPHHHPLMIWLGSMEGEPVLMYTKHEQLQPGCPP